MTTEKLMEILRNGTPEQKAAVKRVLKLAGLRANVESHGGKWTECEDGTVTITATPEQLAAMFEG